MRERKRGLTLASVRGKKWDKEGEENEENQGPAL